MTAVTWPVWYVLGDELGTWAVVRYAAPGTGGRELARCPTLEAAHAALRLLGGVL